VNAATESLDIIAFNLFRAAEIIRSFKEIAVNQSSEVMASFCLDEYIRTILTSLKHELKNRKAEINVNFEGFTVNSYPGAFSHLITNLIMNTLVHGYDQWERVRIDFDARREDGHLVFTYTDHGKGIPPEIIKRIFDPFFTTRRGAGGSGLGLFIVYNVVRDKLGGSIACESVLGDHTTFTIRI
jgi:signal transduction histidine kinase